MNVIILYVNNRNQISETLRLQGKAGMTWSWIEKPDRVGFYKRI